MRKHNFFVGRWWTYLMGPLRRTPTPKIPSPFLELSKAIPVAASFIATVLATSREHSRKIFCENIIVPIFEFVTPIEGSRKWQWYRSLPKRTLSLRNLWFVIDHFRENPIQQFRWHDARKSHYSRVRGWCYFRPSNKLTPLYEWNRELQRHRFLIAIRVRDKKNPKSICKEGFAEAERRGHYCIGDGSSIFSLIFSFSFCLGIAEGWKMLNDFVRIPSHNLKNNFNKTTNKSLSWRHDTQ